MSLVDRPGGFKPTPAIVRPSPEIERRLKKLEKDGSGGGPLVTNVGDNTYEWTEEYTWIAYASDINNASSEGIITSQQDAVDFSFGAISDAGVALSWIGYWTSKSLQQSGDPTDYIWADLDADVPASSISLYYTESTSLLPAVGNPTYPGAGITWTSFTGSTPASAFWVATQYTINGTKTPWRIIPVRTKQTDLGLIIYTISGRNKPTMNDSVWKADAITAISTFTGNTYSTTNEMGFGTVIGITYDNGKLFGMLKKVSGVATWVTTSTFIDGELLISETVVADKIGANAITTVKLNADSITASKIATDAVTADAIAAGSITSSKLVVSGSGAIGAGTIGAATTFHADNAPTATAIGDLWVDTDDKNKLYRASATGSGNWVSVQDTTVADNIYTSSTTTIDGGRITTGSVTSDRLNINERVTIAASGAFAWGKTGPSDTTAGVYMGRDSGTPQVEIGNSSYYLRWNGSYLYGVGMITTAPAAVGQSQNISNTGDTRYDIPLGTQTLDIEVSGGGGGGSGYDAVGGTGSNGSSGGSSTVKVYTTGGSLRTTLLTASGGTGSGQSGRTGQSFDPSGAHSLFTGTGGTGGSGTFNSSSAAGGNASGISAGGGGSIDSGGTSSGSTDGGNAGSYATNASYSVVADGDYLIFSIGAGGSGADGYQNADGGDGTKGAGRVEITAVS